VKPAPRRGEIWIADFDPTEGHEQAGIRPALVLSVDPFNSGPAELAIVLPITTKDKRIFSHVPLVPPEGGLKKNSFILCEAIRSVSIARLSKPLGMVSEDTLDTVEFHLRHLLGFSG
jgi:mRNA interferase MazF